MFWQNLRFAWRSLLSNPGFAAAAILALAVGIGLNTAMFSVVDGILLKPLAFRQSEDLFVLREQVTRSGARSLYFLTAGNFLDYRASARSADVVAYGLSPFSLTLSDGKPERYPGVLVSEGWFSFYGARFLKGRDFSSEDFEVGKDEGVIISSGLWAERFGSDPNIAARQVNLNGRPRKIVGVVDEAFEFPAKTKIWAPLTMTPEESSRRDFHRLIAQGRVRPGYTISQARAEFSSILANLGKQYPQFNAKKSIYIEPLVEELTGKVKPALLALIGAVAFVLAIACANVANLMLARGAVRRGELAVRASLGASRWNLISQLMTESLLLSTLGGVLGLGLAYGAFWAFRIFAPQNIPRLEQVAMDWRVVGYNLAAVLITGLFFGLVPALRLSRVDLHSGLKERTRGGSVRYQFRSLLVVAQVAAALMLMTGAGLLIRSLYELTQVDLGFEPDHLLSMRITPLPAKYDNDTLRQVQFGQAVVRNVSSLPGVKTVALSTSLPFQGNPRYLMSVEQNPVVDLSAAPVTDYFAVSPAYFEAMKIPILAGRAFTDRDDYDAPQVVIVNETFVRTHFPDGRAVGKRMQIGFSEPFEWREIVGVAKDVRNLGLDQAVRVQVYAPFYHTPSIIQKQASTFSVVVRSDGDPKVLAQAVTQKILEADNAQPVWQVQTMATTISESIGQQRLTLFLMVLFAGVAFLLAIIGLSGVVSYTVTQRTREIGIRLAIGAQPRDVLWMILKHSLLLVSAGIVGGVVGSLIVSNVLKNLLFQTSANDPVTLLVVGGVFLVTAALAGLIPARRAAAIDPAETLRAD